MIKILLFLFFYNILCIRPAYSITTAPTFLPIPTQIDRIEKSSFEISEHYFSDILNAQLVIFASIVAIFLGLNWLYQRRVTRDEISKEVKKQMKLAEKHLLKKITQKQALVETQMKDAVEEWQLQTDVLRAGIYRNMGYFFDSQKSYSTAFLWWMRASKNFFSADEDRLTQSSLGYANSSLNRITSASQLKPENISEVQDLLTSINSEKYKVEKELIYQSLKSLLSRQST